MTKDLTIGNPERTLLRFTLPMFVSVAFQQFYNMADSLIAGRFAGEDALAAVGASYPITMIFMAIAVGCNIGCSVVISNLFGAKRMDEMKTAISTTLISAFVLSGILTVAGVVLTSPMMRMIQTPANIFADAALYLRIYTGGFLFLFLYNVCTGVFQSLGDSNTPLCFLIGSSVCNILLDLLFVAVFHWGVAGVAWATFLAQGAACLLAFFTLLRRITKIQDSGKAKRFSLPMLGRIGKMAIPSILQQSFVSVGNLFIQGIINSYGSSVIAGYSAAIKLNTFAITAFTTMSNGLSSFTAQNIGAKKNDRVSRGYRAGNLMILCFALPFCLLFVFAGRSMVGLFMTSESETALSVGVEFLRIISPFYFAVGIKLIADGVLRGAGNVVLFMISTFSDLITRVVLAFVLSASLGVVGIWISWPVGWVLASALAVGFYIYSARVRRRKTGLRYDAAHQAPAAADDEGTPRRLDF
ncbi:MAG: MATE family efflux transporter [Candidatus Howiella sp.]|jgi:putative MATE family efflux protein